MGAGAGAATGRIIAQAITPENLTRDALMARGFKTLSMSPHPVYPEVPTPRGLLNAAPTRLPGSVVTEPESVPPVVGGTSQPYVFGNVKQIGSGRIGEGAEGEVTRERHGPSPFGRTGGPAKAMTVVDPATGQEHLIYLSDVDTEKLHKLILESLKTKDVSGKGK
jgi:hypothetical protein